ncbi:MAG: response regulator [Chloroflexota bacterium]
MAAPQAPLLIVEDIPDTLKLLDATLKFKGYRVVTAVNGHEALEAIKKERPALVITDILMPKMDGFNLVHRLRINPETRNIPVIFLSATYVAPEDKAFATSIGATRFIEKPIDLDSFLQTVADLLKRGVTAPLPPLQEHDFYVGYRDRLQTKLDHKVAQIARIERLLETVSDEEKDDFRASLAQAVSERDEIQNLLAQIREYLE